jgi:UDP-N-acetylglucosamine 3-dehydrogenase
MIKIGILGAGAMGSAHAHAYTALPGVQITAVSSRSVQKAASLAQEKGAKATTDPYQILDDPDIDAVSITLPTHLHETYTLAALQRGKHVLLEKPMALTDNACSAMIQAAREAGRILMIAQVLRFWPEYVAVANLVHSRALGEPRAASAVRICAYPRWGDWFSNPEWTGGAVLDLHIHDLDACNWLLGRPQSIYACGLRGAAGGWDHVLTVVDYGSAKAQAEASWMMPNGYPFTYGLRVVCEHGSITFDPPLDGPDRLLVYEGDKDPYPLQFEPGDAYFNQAAYFIDCVQNNRMPERGTPDQARTAIRTSLAARQSLESGRVIVLGRA